MYFVNCRFGRRNNMQLRKLQFLWTIEKMTLIKSYAKTIRDKNADATPFQYVFLIIFLAIIRNRTI